MFLNGALVIPKQVMDVIEGPQLGSGVLGSMVYNKAISNGRHMFLEWATSETKTSEKSQGCA